MKSSRVQGKMEQRLAENIEALLADRGIPGSVERQWGRLVIRETDPDAAADAASDAFGVVSASPARSVTPEMDDITGVLAETARDAYTEGAFAVDARRAGEHDFTSEDVGRVGGQAVWEAVEDAFDPEVDLDDPDVTFSVEVRAEEAFVFLENREGPGGLPLGTQNPLVALVSGGIDSPVAAYLGMKRGAPIIPVYLDLGPFGGPDHEARAVETVRRLADFAPNYDMTVRRVAAGEYAQRLHDEVGKTRMLSYRRFMYMVAEEIAHETGAVGIVTGEAIGQKSSQTTTNLGVVDRATSLPVHRPLLTMDKQEIIALARDLDTYRDSTMNVGCERLAPNSPETKGSHAATIDAEPDALPEWARAAAQSATTIDPRGELGEVDAR
ncbi:tRNA 4-thiouridine(8) synthase ThiI [Halocalculus aciditolerans]|uniref:Probable tRNA sulfurtransferase n=1 Tax=Halocalculus aciditolerans TaxID=1383812 RepID=A0A830FJU3_9EURY|nr:tRNA 4-thiouridine(8) synthase ThiI [Halocalculus aciditolerans]